MCSQGNSQPSAQRGEEMAPGNIVVKEAPDWPVQIQRHWLDMVFPLVGV